MNKYIKFAVLALLAVGAFYWLNAEKEKPIEYITKPVEKGNITEKILNLEAFYIRKSRIIHRKRIILRGL